VGERFGIEWLTYNPFLFVIYHREATASADGVADALIAACPSARSFVDVGAGSGAHAAALARRGRTAVACERSLVGRVLARWQGVKTRRLDLTADGDVPADLRPDVAYCFEVAEHLDEEVGFKLVRLLAATASTVVFSAAQPGQGGQGHRNERPLAYWQRQFEAAGMAFDEGSTTTLRNHLTERRVPAYWLSRNSLVFVAPERP
jgi:hypothetical protein